MTKRIAIVPARGNSKRLINKNIKLFHKKPLISYSLEALKKSNLFDKIHVSTEDKKIQKIVEKMGHKIDFLRNKKLSGDKIEVKKVLEFVIDKYIKRGEFFDEVFLIFATNPFINSKDLKKAYKKYCYFKKNFSIMSVVKFNKPVEWAMKKDIKKKVLIPKFPKKIKKSSKFLDTLYYEAGMFVNYKKNYQYKKVKLSYKPYELNYLKSVDIDDLEDFKIAELLYEKN